MKSSTPNTPQNRTAPIRHIMWDWNGTLLNDAWLCVEIMNGMLTSHGLPAMSHDRYQDIFDFPVSDYYQQAGWDFGKTPFEPLSNQFMDGYYSRNGECRVHEGAEALLRSISLPQSILTASKQSLIDDQLQAFGLADIFAGVNGLDNHHAAGKLHVGKIRVEEIGLPPEQILMIGDTTHDAELAQELGLQCWLTASGHQSRARLEALGVPVFDNLQQMPFAPLEMY